MTYSATITRSVTVAQILPFFHGVISIALASYRIRSFRRGFFLTIAHISSISNISRIAVKYK